MFLINLEISKIYVDTTDSSLENNVKDIHLIKDSMRSNQNEEK